MNIDDLLRAAVGRGASDLHLKVGAYPMMRLRGALVRPEHLETLLEQWRDALRRSRATDGCLMRCSDVIAGHDGAFVWPVRFCSAIYG